ncbi:MAG: bifunctional metallophosphatase/5'-nucleotidase [Alistipes sp.]|nr:bifunctional metallophosphatase/5'-nucleotidase [Alistipes sp.]
MQKISFFLSTLFLVALLAGCNKANDRGHIYIISTNDIHATIDAMPQLATIVKEYEAKGEVILVDSGDRVTGNAYVDDATEPGIPIIELMNEVGYDVATLGNHEFDKGREVLYAMLEASDFEWVCSNMTDLTGDIRIKPYTTITIEDIELCFAGVVDTDGGGHPLGGESSYVDFSFTRDIDTAYELCATLPESDFVVLLSHMGLDVDRRLAERGTTYDWIVGGHSHDICGEYVNNTYISQNNKNIRYVTVADITYHKGSIESVKYEQLKMADKATDKEVAAMVAQLKLSDPALNTVEAIALSPATKEGVSNFTIDALATYPYPEDFVPEITFYHYGGVRIDGFAGDIKRVDILNNDPFISTIYIGEMTPAEIERFILEKYNNGTPENPDKESHYPYFRSDLEYTILLEDEPSEGPDAIDIIHNLEPRSYRVAMCNYVAENYIDKDLVASHLHNTGITVREAMLRYARTFGKGGYTPDNECHQHEVRASELK